jgi:DnaK suppressor protein
MGTQVSADYRPSENEPFMNERQREYFRRKLNLWKEEILKESRETIQNLQAETVPHADLADRASTEAERQLELRTRDRQRKLIAKIDSALRRLEDGSYGFCEETGETHFAQKTGCPPHRHPVHRGAGASRAAREGLSGRLGKAVQQFPRLGNPRQYPVLDQLTDFFRIFHGDALAIKGQGSFAVACGHDIAGIQVQGSDGGANVEGIEPAVGKGPRVLYFCQKASKPQHA